MTEPERSRTLLSFENRLALLAFCAGLPASLAAVYLLWNGEVSPRLRWLAIAAIGACWLGFSLAVRDRVTKPLQTLSNLLAALQEGDYSIRGRSTKSGDALDLVYRELNTLSATLQSQRLGALEATALLRTVMSEIDVALFTFDNEHRLRLVNRAGEELLRQPAEKLLGRTDAGVGLQDLLDGPAHFTTQRTFPGGAGRWGIRLNTFRENGLPHRLLVIEDLTRALREEELLAWKRLVRVLGHELNNSLTPIQSIAGSLTRLIEREPAPPDWRDDTRKGLGIIEARAAALTRFLEAYARLARLPAPTLAPVEVAAWIRRAASLETRVPLDITPGPALTIQGDIDQLEQLLINLLRNAAEASLETGGRATVEWSRHGNYLEVAVRDEGRGIANTANLFVPFFTTKPGGSGIGLVLCRQIAEGHRGELTLDNRRDRPGGQATLRLPI